MWIVENFPSRIMKNQKETVRVKTENFFKTKLQQYCFLLGIFMEALLYRAICVTGIKSGE